jgi:hypothetical protein
VLALKDTLLKQVPILSLRLPPRIRFSFHGATDVRARRAGCSPTVDKLRGPWPNFRLMRCFILNIIDVGCVLDNVL